MPLPKENFIEGTIDRGSAGLCSVVYQRHFALFYSDNKCTMLVKNWSNVEEKGALGACPQKIL